MLENKTQVKNVVNFKTKKNTTKNIDDKLDYTPPERVEIIKSRMYWIKGEGIFFYSKEGKPTQLWSENEVPIVHAIYFRTDTNGYDHRLYDVSIASDRHILSTREMLNGMFIDYFPHLTNIATNQNRSKYIDTIRCLSSLETTHHYHGKNAYGVHYDEQTNQYVRLFPNGHKRYHGDISPLIELYPIPDFLDKSSWESRFNYIQPTMKEQHNANNYLNAITPQGEAKLVFIHGIGCLSFWLDYELAQRYTLMIQGKAGSGKTALSRIAASTAYPHTKKYNGNVNFKASPYEIESTINNSRHTPFSIDDNNNGINIKACSEILEKIVRSCFNGDEIRGRRTPSGDKKPANYVRTNPIFTTETIPQGIEDSLIQRMLFLTLEQNYINISVGSDKPDITEINNHVTSLYYWSDEYDKHMFAWVAREGYEKVKKELSERQLTIIIELQQELKQRWSQIHALLIDEAIRRYADMASYLLLHAQIMDEVSNNAFMFEQSIKPLIFNMAMKQFSYLGFKQSQEGTIPVKDVIIELLDKIGRNEKIDGTVYCVQDAKTGTCPIVSVNGEIINHRQFGYKLNSNSTNQYSLQTRGSIPLMYIDKDMLYLTDTARTIMLKQPALSFLKSDKELNEHIENVGLLKKRGKTQRTINPRMLGTRPRVLAIDLHAILEEMYKDVSNDDTPSEETAEKQKDAVTETFEELKDESETD